MYNTQTESIYGVAYLRVSDPSQLRGESPEDQQKRIQLTAERVPCQLWPDDQVHVEAYSGRKNSRPKYDELIKQIKQAKKQGVPIQYFIIRGIDRFTRGGASDYEKMKSELAELEVQLLDSYGIIQARQNTLAHLGFTYDWSEYSPSETAELIEASRSKQEVREILTRMISAEIQLTQKGYKIRQANDGYLNKKVITNSLTGKEAVIQVPDPKRAHFYQAMFKLRAAGTLTDQEIVARVNAMGFLTKRKKRWNRDKSRIIGYTGEKPLQVKQFQKVIQKPIYAGVICEKWTNYQPIKASYKGLVSIDLFNKANRGKVFIHKKADGSLEILNDFQQKTRKRNNPNFPYKNVIRCHLCHKLLKGSASRSKSGKRVPYYHCNRDHKYFGIRTEKMEELISEFLKQIQLSSKYLRNFQTGLLLNYRRRKTEIAQFASQVDQKISELEMKQTQLIEAFTNAKTDIVRSSLEKQINDLQIRIESGHATEPKVELKEKDIYDFIDLVGKIVEHPEKMLKNNRNVPKQQAYFGLIFKELPTVQELLSRTPQLTLIFKLYNDFPDMRYTESLLANQQRLQWNTLVEEIQGFRDLSKIIDL